jgi:hypothetical protein
MAPAQVKSSAYTTRRESYCHAGGARAQQAILLICLTAQSSVAQITTRCQAFSNDAQARAVDFCRARRELLKNHR